MNNFKIAWMFPNQLYLHGERGNVLALERFSKIGGFNSVTDYIDFDTNDFRPLDYQILFFGTGEISSFKALTEWLNPYREELEEFINIGRPVIVTGTTMALFALTTKRCSGEAVSGLGITGMKDFESIEKEYVYGDDVYFETEYNGKRMEIIGNQIQMMDLKGDYGEKNVPFGRLIYGYGNNGTDINEGMKVVNSIFTNCLGPMLVCNPWLTIEIIKAAAVSSGLEADADTLNSFDDDLERKSFATKREFILTKETELKNFIPAQGFTDKG